MWFFFSLRGVQWGALCLHRSEHRNAAETEGNADFHSKGRSVTTETQSLIKQNKSISFIHSCYQIYSCDQSHFATRVVYRCFRGQALSWCFLVKFYYSICPPSPRAYCIYLAVAQNQSGAAWLYWLPGLVFVPPQNEDSSTHEKLDFKLHFTCTSYLITTPCYRLVCCVLISLSWN